MLDRSINKIFVLGMINIFILVIFPQNILAIETEIDTGEHENYQNDLINDIEKSEWKTNSFCRVRADGMGWYSVNLLNGNVIGSNDFWCGIARKISADVCNPGSLKISGREGSDYVRGDIIEIRGDFFFGIILVIHWGCWNDEIHLMGFVLNCRYKVSDNVH